MHKWEQNDSWWGIEERGPNCEQKLVWLTVFPIEAKGEEHKARTSDIPCWHGCRQGTALVGRFDKEELGGGGEKGQMREKG